MTFSNLANIVLLTSEQNTPVTAFNLERNPFEKLLLIKKFFNVSFILYVLIVFKLLPGVVLHYVGKDWKDKKVERFCSPAVIFLR